MNTDRFVEECRREWARLGVPDEVAEEMAAELRADLADAAADDVPAEELLGAGAFDARGFAASWASERGVVPARRKRALPRPGLLAGALAAVAAVGLAAGLLSTRSTTPKHVPLTQAAPTAAAPSGAIVVLDPRTGRVVRALVAQEVAVATRQAHP